MPLAAARAWQGESRAQYFYQLDLDNNRLVSRHEASSNDALSSLFGQVDANGDGELSSSEFEAVPLFNRDGTPVR